MSNAKQQLNQLLYELKTKSKQLDASLRKAGSGGQAAIAEVQRLGSASGVEAFLDNPAGTRPSPDIVSSKQMDCEKHGPWTEQVKKVKVGPGSYMLLPSRCSGCLKEEREASDRNEAYLKAICSRSLGYTEKKGCGGAE